ncbi:enoyl-CoA hydratase-related protein [Reichenbachiella sp.]|uniref:enoyl-CoA hydratase-related protein n=1 Tax=Reichenbachiella sp. TaxID=2184521 RepID=UPI003BAF4DF6
MRILFLVTSHNGLSQRLFCELVSDAHKVQVYVLHDDVETIKVVDDYNPDLIIAPFLKTAIPDSVWKKYVCLIVHPGIVGDRGPSALDWAIMKAESIWGVTVLQAAQDMDAGDVWASDEFEMRNVTKSNLYRHEVTQAASRAIKKAIANFQDEAFRPEVLDYKNSNVKGCWNNPIKRSDRAFEWSDTTNSIVRKIKAADSTPGLLETKIFEEPFFMYGAHPESILKGQPGEIIAKRNGAICVGTGDGSLWVTHLKKKGGGVKRKSTDVLGEILIGIPEAPLDPFDSYNDQDTFREIWVEEAGDILYIHFDFYNGAMSTDQCNSLRKVFMQACQLNHKMIVLQSGGDIWSNGIDLNAIECADNPADESWKNIVAIDDLIREIINCESKIVVSSITGNAGAGGAIMALAADFVFARDGIVLNPHYKNMGLFGSEYWTYLLPKRVGQKNATQLTEDCSVLVASQAKKLGFVDDCFGETLEDFKSMVKEKVRKLAEHAAYDKIIADKRLARLKHETKKSLDSYRDEELKKMNQIFYDPESDYHLKRHFFVCKVSPQRQIESNWSVVNYKCIESKPVLENA